MIELTEPQVWTLIGVFAASSFGMMALVSTLFIRVLRAEIGGLRGEMNGRFEAVDANIDGKLEGLRGEMNARFESVDRRLDGLDRDVQLLIKHTFPPAA